MEDGGNFMIKGTCKIHNPCFLVHGIIENKFIRLLVLGTEILLFVSECTFCILFAKFILNNNFDIVVAVVVVPSSSSSLRLS